MARRSTHVGRAPAAARTGSLKARSSAGLSGEVQRMKESYEKGVAIRLGPELCGASREAGLEALVGVRAGRVFSPEIFFNWGADAVSVSGRPHSAHQQREMGRDPTGS